MILIILIINQSILNLVIVYYKKIEINFNLNLNNLETLILSVNT